MYQLRETDTACILIPETAIIKTALELSEPTALIYYYDQLIVTTDKKQVERIEPDDVVRLRLFNGEAEIYAWRSNGILTARLRVDAPGVQAGTTYERIHSADTESWLDNNSAFSGKSGRITVRNYAKLNASNQFYYFDARIIRLQ